MSNINITSYRTVECESFLRQETTGVVYALAPMEIVAGLAAFNIPIADTSRSTATCKAGIAGDVMSRTMRLTNMVAFPFTLFFVSALYVAGVPAFVSVIIGGL